MITTITIFLWNRDKYSEDIDPLTVSLFMISVLLAVMTDMAIIHKLSN
jgi:hypothetical protein